MKLHHARGPGFSTAVRRVYSRRERHYASGVRERLDVAEEAPTPQLHPARERALGHLSAAYAVAGYAQAGLCVLASGVLGGVIVAFTRGVVADVARKTRARLEGLAEAAVQCAAERVKNGCVENGVHPTPVMDGLCRKWAACVRRGDFAKSDAISASVWAETFAETVNAFTDRISSTSVLIGMTVFMVLMFFMSSAAFGFMHRRLVDDRLVAATSLPAGTLLEEHNRHQNSMLHSASPSTPKLTQCPSN